MIRRILHELCMHDRRKKFNRMHQVQINSRYADLQASYGRGVSIGKGSYIDQDVSIGDFSYVNQNSSLENCVVGKYCSISSGVYVNPYEHDNHLFTTHPVVRNGVSDGSRPKVLIGNDVLISLNVIILSGVTVGDGAVIGAGAVVTSDVAPYEIVGGVPSKHIRWRFDEVTRQMLQRIQWWNWSKEQVLKNLSFLKRETDVILEDNLVCLQAAARKAGKPF